MILDEKTYLLPDSNYIKAETIKKQIIIGHTSSLDMLHHTKWINRLNGNYKKTAAFSIDKDGVVFNHFDPIFFSNFTENLETDKKSIVILLENEGWLIKNNEKNEYINWIGYIYNKPDLVVEKRWRGYTYWAPYTPQQFNSAVELANKLCDEFFIPNIAIPHNTKVDKLDSFQGVLYNSNFEKLFTDLSPAWNCEEFKYKFENS